MPANSAPAFQAMAWPSPTMFRSAKVAAPPFNSVEKTHSRRGWAMASTIAFARKA